MCWTSSSRSLSRVSRVEAGLLCANRSAADHVDTNLPITCIAALLEMQTIAGCFHIFAYLESRVERLTAVGAAS